MLLRGGLFGKLFAGGPGGEGVFYHADDAIVLEIAGSSDDDVGRGVDALVIIDQHVAIKAEDGGL